MRLKLRIEDDLDRAVAHPKFDHPGHMSDPFTSVARSNLCEFVTTDALHIRDLHGRFAALQTRELHAGPRPPETPVSRIRLQSEKASVSGLLQLQGCYLPATSMIDDCSGAGQGSLVRKRHIRKAGKKLDAEAKAIVWSDLFKRPTVKITVREHAAARIKKRDFWKD